MLELYSFEISTCSQKVRLCLGEKRLQWVDYFLSAVDREHLRPEYLAINPNGVVPTLVHDGQTILDSSVIMEYLDEVFPDTSLTPSTPLGRARMRAWLRFFEEVPTVAVRFPSYNQAFLPLYAGQSKQVFDREAEVRPLRKHFYQSMGQGGFSEKQVNEAFDRMRTTVNRMERGLGESGGPWLLGEQLTTADMCVAPLIDRMDDLGHAWLWAEAPLVTAWLARLRARPCWPIAFFKGSRISDTIPIKSLPVA